MNIVYNAWQEARSQKEARIFRFTLYLKGGAIIYGAPHRVSENDTEIKMDLTINREHDSPTNVLIDEVAAVTITYF